MAGQASNRLSRRLLLRMSARKVIDKRRHNRRQRRGGDAEVRSLGDGFDNETVIEALGDEPSREMVLMMQESVERFFFAFGCRATAGFGGC